MRDEATEAQVRAADPGSSTWLSANAGSGKTRVLTDRVARLLLTHVPPERILCLTYTKAAASEMQNRLFKRLGAWAMLDDRDLAREMELLGVPASENTPSARRQARTLFARAIETPGGLKIQTIHSFCATLLRRFPLEAGVSPRFAEMDERAGQLLREEVLDEMADVAAPGPIDGLVRHLSGEEPTAFIQEIVAAKEHLLRGYPKEEIHAALGLAPGDSISALLAEVFIPQTPEVMAQLCRALATGGISDRKTLELLQSGDFARPGLAELRLLEAVMLYGEKAKVPFGAKIGRVPTRAARPALGGSESALDALMERVEAARPRRQALLCAERARALYEFAAAFVPEYERRKQLRGLLDFDDLILKARGLLTDPSVAQWVLFRLDGGIDHMLVDEAQDTAPAQWDVIRLLAQEFTAGAGARPEIARTIFVVGDKKQSIYSFQGADPDAFDRMRSHFGAELEQVGQRLYDRELLFSFRSSATILRLVDRVFEGAASKGVRGETLHRAFHAELPGRVDLWPAIAAAESPPDQPWTDPLDKPAPNHHTVRLGEKIAAEIEALIGTPLPRADGSSRPIRAGDFLILVQRRREIFAEIIRACKARGLPLAGADRLKLGAEMAVRDLSAMLRFLALTEDSLSLAAALRSPLLGWDEAALYNLAQGRRQGFLWAELRDRAAEFAPTLAVLQDLLDHTDYLRPYDLIERILTRHGGRLRLLSQLGPEAEDGIDALLAQALAYEQSETPSLTGFLGWLASDDVDIKRQVDSGGDWIRVMSVHGAKGLEAPIVILPDTADRKLTLRRQIMELPGGARLWNMPKADCPAALLALRHEAEARERAERLRLLYVAMTRAEQWLIVGAAGATEDLEGCWHALLAQAMAEENAARLEDGTLRLEGGRWPEAMALASDGIPAAGQAAEEPGPGTLPEWAVLPAPLPPRPVRPLLPSDLEGAKALAQPGEADADPGRELAMDRGTAIHRLLEVLPAAPRSDWPALLRDVVRPMSRLAGQEDLLLAEATAVLDHPDFREIFTSSALAEVEIAAPPGLARDATRPIIGTVDRLLVEPGQVRIIDFKTNLAVPDRPEDVPLGILRQMGAYREVISAVYPEHAVSTEMLWTRGPTLMPLPEPLIRDAWRTLPSLDPAPGDT